MKKCVTLIMICATIGVVSGVISYQTIRKKMNKEVCLNVFVHGTHLVGSGIEGLKSKATTPLAKQGYKALYSMFCNTAFLHRNRLVTDRGLHSFKVVQKSWKDKSVAPIILDLVDKVHQEYSVDTTPQRYYTFGWNGQLDQTERRVEAVRLYNELAMEVDKLKEQGYKPKIRLLGYSHGGNVSLNLAAIHYALNGVAFKDRHFTESIASVWDIFSEDILQKRAEKEVCIAYHKPLKSIDLIDELILYATPVQTETECFAFTDYFKKVTMFYSENDMVQVADVLSTKSRVSRRTLEKRRCRKIQNSLPNPVNVKLMIQRNQSFPKNLPVNLKAAMRGGAPLTMHPYDPAHADFWCVVWDKKGVFYDPVPLVVFTPIILSMLKGVHRNVDLRIFEKNGDAYFALEQHTTRDLVVRKKLEMSFIQGLKESLLQEKEALLQL